MKIKLFVFVLPHFQQNILYMDKWSTSFGSMVPNLIVNYHLEVFYHQLYHFGTNANYWCAIIINGTTTLQKTANDHVYLKDVIDNFKKIFKTKIPWKSK